MARRRVIREKAGHTIVVHPYKYGNWPDGEPQSVRDAADRKQQERKQEKKNSR